MEILVLKGVDLKNKSIYNIYCKKGVKMKNIKETTADYSWQREEFDRIKVILDKENNDLISLEACVGSGKTRIAFMAFENFINNHKDSKTCQIFVAPRIKLVKQQIASCKEYFKNINYDNVKCIEVDCESTDREFGRGDISDDNEACNLGTHVIYFVCIDSFMGDPIKEKYWNALFKNNGIFGRANGEVFFDEAHNYESYKEAIYGKALIKKINRGK